jgi:hypothetical protein
VRIRRAIPLVALTTVLGWSAAAGYSQAQPGADAVATANDQGKDDIIPDSGPSRSDADSAAVTAQLRNAPVEDLSQGTDKTRVLANPDGTWVVDIGAGARRVKDRSTKKWHDVDTSLVVSGGRLVPRRAAVPISLSAGGDREMVRVGTTHGSKTEMSWKWRGPLPTPVVDGPKATYKGVAGGGDLEVIATATGFTYNVVLTERPSHAKEVAFEVPVATPNSTLRQKKDGTLLVVADDGTPLAHANTPVMWDASGGDSDVPGHAPVRTEIAPGGDGSEGLILKPSMDYLLSPDTTYPVTIDPTFQFGNSVNAWVSSDSPNIANPAPTYLRAGRLPAPSSGAARTFLKFDGDTSWAGKEVISANLVLRNYSSGSCATGALRAEPITQTWDASSLTWNNQPAVEGTPATYTAAHGAGDACPEADATWDVTSVVRSWADGTKPNNGIRVAAQDESDPSTERLYRSASFGTDVPRLVVVLNTRPDSPTNLAVGPKIQMGGPTVASATPALQADVYDADSEIAPDPHALTANFKVFHSGTQVWAGSTSLGEGTARVRVDEAAGLTPGSTYTWTVDVVDAAGSVSPVTTGPSFSVALPPAADLDAIRGAATRVVDTTRPELVGPDGLLSRTVWANFQASLGACMAIRGFNYGAVPSPDPQHSTPGQDGYGISAASVDPTVGPSPAIQAYLDGLTDSQRTAYRVALHGDVSDGRYVGYDGFSVAHQGSSAETAGCEGLVRSIVAEPAMVAWAVTRNELQPVWDQTEADPAFQAANAAWSQCMSAQGFSFADYRDPPLILLEELSSNAVVDFSTRQSQVAGADQNCRASSELQAYLDGIGPRFIQSASTALGGSQELESVVQDASGAEGIE